MVLCHSVRLNCFYWQDFCDKRLRDFEQDGWSLLGLITSGGIWEYVGVAEVCGSRRFFVQFFAFPKILMRFFGF